MAGMMAVAAVAPAMAQVEQQPLDSGIILPPTTPETPARDHCRTVYSSGDFGYRVDCGRFGAVDWSTSLTVVTGGPSVQVTVSVPLYSFLLVSGDRLVTTVTVTHYTGSGSGQSTQSSLENPVSRLFLQRDAWREESLELS
jgi:hypothetical protein